jgi:lipopolysaccharide export system protein LptA
MRRPVAELAALVALAALALPGAAGAQESAAGGGSTLERLRPTGPVTVTADRAEWQKGGAMVYTGNVAMASSTLTMKGDRLELRQQAQGQYRALLTGSPARLDHAAVPGTTGAESQPVSAQAKSLAYDSASGVVQIDGGAHLVRGSDEITGETIRYDVTARRIAASGGQGGQVRIVIQPPPASAAPPEKKQ